jgi:hypothetical protein
MNAIVKHARAGELIRMRRETSGSYVLVFE